MHGTDMYSQYSSIILLVWLNSWVFVYKLSGCGFESHYCHLEYSVALFWNFGISTALILWRWYKYRLLSKHFLQRQQQYGNWRKLKVPTNFYKRQSLPVITWNKNIHRTKLHIQTGKKSFRSYYFSKSFWRFLWLISFQTSKKAWSILSFALVFFLHF